MRQIHDIRLGARGRTAHRWRRGRWRPVRGDTVLRAAGGGEPVLLRRDVGAAAAHDGWSGGAVRRYHRAGGIVTRRRRRPSPFPFSLPDARTNTRTRVLRLAVPRSIPIHTRAHARTLPTHANAVCALAAVWFGSLTRQSRTDRPTICFVAVTAVIFDRNKKFNLYIIINVAVVYYY